MHIAPHTVALSRRQFLAAGSAAAAGLLLGCAGSGRSSASRVARPATIRLEGIEVVRYNATVQPNGVEKIRTVLRVRGSSGAEGYSVGAMTPAHVASARELLEGLDLTDHDAVWDRLNAAGFPRIGYLDMALWDMHARALGKPLHAVLGTKRTEIPLYGDQRLHWYGNDTDRYAAACADGVRITGCRAIKLHFPGTYADGGMEFQRVIECLHKVRGACGPDVMLAWDPHPQAATSDEEDKARTIVHLMDRLGYEWVEGPVDPHPPRERMRQYIALREEVNLRFELEGLRTPTPMQTRMEWIRAGAINQANWDCMTRTGVTPYLRLLELARTEPKLGLHLNPHCHWPPHQHLAAATEPQIQPWQEFCGFPDPQKSGRFKEPGGWWVPEIRDGMMRAPTAPGMFEFDWEFIRTHRVE